MQRVVYRSLLLIAAFAAPVSQPAAAAASQVENLTVVGSRTTGAGSLPVLVSTIDRAALEAASPASVLDVLRGAPGLQATQYGGRAGSSSVFVQGGEPNFLVVTIDGVKVNDPNNSRGGSFNFATLNVAEIERIEILRGPQSALYGSDSLSGVINIVTRAPGVSPTVVIDAEAGQDDLVRYAVHGTAVLPGNHSVAATVSRVREGEVSPGNDFENVSAAFRLRRDGATSYDVSARWADTEARAFPEDSGGDQLAALPGLDTRDTRQMSVSGALSTPLSAHWMLHVHGGYYDQEEDFVSPGIAAGVRDGVPPNSSLAELARTHATMYATYDAGDTFALSLGADYQREDGEQRGAVEFAPGLALPTDFSLDRNIAGVFGEVRWRPRAPLLLSAAWRHDDPDSADAETTLRIGSQYALDRLRFFANWGQGFKLPSFFALGHGLVGNPELAPETSSNWSAGVEFQTADAMTVTASAFRNEFEDLIDFDFERFTNVNRNRVDTGGFELSARYQAASATTVRVHATYVDVDVRGGGKLRQRPNLRGGASIDHAVNDAWRVHLAWLYTGEHFDSSVPTGGLALAGYHRFDAGVQWQARPGITLWLAVDNAADRAYEESLGFSAPGARARVGVRVRL